MSEAKERTFGLTADGPMDVRASEQSPCSLHYADKNLSVANVFFGFFIAFDATQQTHLFPAAEIFLCL